jgi:hypothetical protein
MPARSAPFAALLALASSSLFAADLAWLDFQLKAFGPAPLHRAVPAIADLPHEINGLTFTLSGSGIDARNRTLPDPMLNDFVFVDGEGATLTLLISGLAAGTYSVESWHYDGAGHAGALRIENKPRNAAQPTTALADFTFSTEPATFTFTTDGSPHELIFTENDRNNRLRINGLRIRRAGNPPTPPGKFIDIARPAGNAAPIITTVSGLIPGRSYGIHLSFSAPSSAPWQVKAGLTPAILETFTHETPPERLASLGSSPTSRSTHHSYLGFIGDAVAAADGTLSLHATAGRPDRSPSRPTLKGFVLSDATAPAPLPAGATQIAPDGAWTWFNDERAIIHQGSLFAGYVKGNGDYGVTRHDLATGQNFHMTISTGKSREQDDHNNPSITVLPDGKLMLLYSKHHTGREFFQRTSLVPLPSTGADWGPEIIRPTQASNTYANTYLLRGENQRIYNFHRSINFNPTLTLSDDLGKTWGPSRQFLGTGSGSTRPYPRYTSNGVDRIDLIYTDGHPRDVNNSVYHLYYQNGSLWRTDGTLINSLASIPLNHDGGERGSVIYPFSNAPWGPGDGPDQWIPAGRGWTWDIHYDATGHPVCVFQVQKDNVTGNGWNHARIYYYYTRWTGTEWQRRFIAHAGRPLYPAEDDYAGGMCLDPEDPRVVYISTNAANPFQLGDLDDVPLRENDRYEIYRGITTDGGLTFTWTPVTEDSAADNLRPIVPPHHGRSEFLVWFHGTYSTYTQFSTQVLARISEAPEATDGQESDAP